MRSASSRALAAIVGAVLTVICTAMIYASLKPIPAWRHALVVPAYLLFALLCGSALLAAGLVAMGGIGMASAGSLW